MVAAVPTRIRRAAAVLVAAPVLVIALAACGGGSNSLTGVKVTGAFGQAPTFAWSGSPSTGSAKTTTLIQGSGAALKAGDHVLVNFAIGDGTTKSTPVTTFDDSTGALGLQVSQAPPAQPQVLGDVFTTDLLKYVKPGVKVGSRIAVSGETDKVFPQIWSELPELRYDIGNQDGLVVVMDIVGIADSPSGATQTPPSWAPKVVTKSDLPASLDFSKTPKPDNKLQVATLIKGTGPAVKEGQTAAVKYLGQVYKGAKPFDESYSTNRFLYAQTGTKADPNKTMESTVIKGWSQALVGVPVGSRVLIQIPPALGYGANPPQGSTIPKNATLYFVVDVLGAA